MADWDKDTLYIYVREKKIKNVRFEFEEKI